MKIKWPLIFAIFGMPLLIVFVLHFWGENRFDVQVYYTDEIKTDRLCGNKETPYLVIEEFRSEDSLTVYFAFRSKPDEHQRLQVMRVADRFNSSPVSLIGISASNMGSVPGLANVFKMSEESYDQTMKCEFIMENSTDVVLIDGRGQIRGYYESKLREEIDRLEVEMEILLTNGEFKSTN